MRFNTFIFILPFLFFCLSGCSPKRGIQKTPEELFEKYIACSDDVFSFKPLNDQRTSSLDKAGNYSLRREVPRRFYVKLEKVFKGTRSSEGKLIILNAMLGPAVSREVVDLINPRFQGCLDFDSLEYLKKDHQYFLIAPKLSRWISKDEFFLANYKRSGSGFTGCNVISDESGLYSRIENLVNNRDLFCFFED